MSAQSEKMNYRDIPLFEGISDHELNTLLHCMNGYERSYKKGEILILDQEAVHYIGVVLSGTIHMLKEDLWGEQTLLTYITAGDLIGELFAVTKSTRSYVTFTAASDALVLFIPAYNIIHSCPNQCSFHATLTQNMFHILGMKSMRLLERIEISSRSSLREKILAYLSLLAQRQDTRYVKSPLGRTELADYLDANRSALTRELANMKRDGIIDFDRNTFLIKASVRSD